MKTTILAFSIAAFAAIAGVTGASAFSAPAGISHADNSRVTPVTWFGYYGYRPYGYGSYRHHGWRHGGYRWHRRWYSDRDFPGYSANRNRYW